MFMSKETGTRRRQQWRYVQFCSIEIIDACTCRICYHAVLIRMAFDVLYHPLSFCCSLLQSPSPQCNRGHYLLSLVLHLSCPVAFHFGFHLFVQHLLRSSDLCSPLTRLHSDCLSLLLPFLLFCLCLTVCLEKRLHY